VIGVTATVGLFSFQRIRYDTDLWWLVRPHADAPRFLRASVASSLVLVTLAVGCLLGRARPPRAIADGEAQAPALRGATACTDTAGYLALLGDKTLLFGDADSDGEHPDGFIQYCVTGRSWVALGDPIIADAGASPQAVARVRRELAWRFK